MKITLLTALALFTMAHIALFSLSLTVVVDKTGASYTEAFKPMAIVYLSELLRMD